jgi:membrane protein implicated in regulation of membrane protease activity
MPINATPTLLQMVYQMSPTILWLLLGAILCLMELFVPTAFVEFMMGLSALAVAAIALVVPNFALQVVLWIALSAGSIFFSRRILSRSKLPHTLADAQEAQTLTAIPPGEAGRILYDGNSWRARCDDPQLAIAPNQKVLVVGRQGNTLVVVPESLLHS